MTNEIYLYDGTEIAFQMGPGNVTINASQMAKPFGKKGKPGLWLRTDQAKEYVKALTEVHKCTSADLLQITKGGNKEQGTWMHEDLALEFARWLSPKFGIWCNQKIKDLLKRGTASLSQEERTMLTKSNEQLSQLKFQIEESKPKIEFAEAILEDGDSVSVNILAVMLTDNGCDIGRNKLYQFLREYGFVCKGKNGNFNMPTRRYSNEGLFCIKYPQQEEGEPRPKKVTIKPTTYVTPQGVQYFLRNKDIIQAFLRADKLKTSNK